MSARIVHQVTCRKKQVLTKGVKGIPLVASYLDLYAFLTSQVKFS